MPGLRGTNEAHDLIINGVTCWLARGAYTKNKPAFVSTSMVPLKPDDAPFVTKLWQNLGAGAGWTRETPESAAGGGYSHGQNITSQTPGIIMPAGRLEEITLPAGVTSGIYDAEFFDGDLWISTSGRYLVNVAGGTATAGTREDLGSGYTSSSLQVFDSALLISGAGSGSIFSYNGSTFTQGTSVERSRLDQVAWTIGDYLATGASAGTAGGYAQRLIGTNASGTGFYHLASGANPLVAGNWSSLIPLDSSPYTIQNIVAAAHTVWFSGVGGLYGVDGLGWAPNLTPWVKKFYSGSNGAACMYHDGYVFYGHRHGLAMVPTTGERQDTPVWIQFGNGTANGTPIYGRPYHLESAGSCLYVAYGDSGSTYIMALRMTSDGPIWSGPERFIDGEQPTMLRVMDLGGRPYLVIGTSASGTPKLYRMSLPLTGSPYSDYLQNTAHEFATDSSLTLSKWDLNDPSPKEVHQYEIISENLGEGKSITLNVSTDGAAYVDQGVAQTSPRRVLLPSIAASAGVDAQIRLDLLNPADDPVVLRMVAARMSVQPEPIEINEYTLMIQEGQQLLNTSTQRNLNPKSVFRSLLALPTQGTVSMTDQFGDSLQVRVRSVVDAQVHEEAKGKPWTAIVTLRVVVLSRQVLYNDGVEYGTGESYS